MRLTSESDAGWRRPSQVCEERFWLGTADPQGLRHPRNACCSGGVLTEAPADEFLHRLGSGPPQLGQQLAASSSLAME